MDQRLQLDRYRALRGLEIGGTKGGKHFVEENPAGRAARDETLPVPRHLGQESLGPQPGRYAIDDVDGKPEFAAERGAVDSVSAAFEVGRHQRQQLRRDQSVDGFVIAAAALFSSSGLRFWMALAISGPQQNQPPRDVDPQQHHGHERQRSVHAAITCHQGAFGEMDEAPLQALEGEAGGERTGQRREPAHADVGHQPIDQEEPDELDHQRPEKSRSRAATDELA